MHSDPTPTSAAWRLIIGGVVLAMAASGCRDSATKSTPRSTARQASTVVATPQTTIANLAAAGIATVATVASTAPQLPVSGTTVLTVTQWQADNMTREVNARGGIPGSDLDDAVPMPGAPPLSDIVGTWSSAAADPAERAANQLLGKPDWGESRNVVFPTEVLALFVGDALQHATTQPSQSNAAGTAGADYVFDPSSSGKASSAVSAQNAALTLTPASAVTAPCSAISGFFNEILDSVFNALKLDPDSVGAWVSGKLGGGVIGAAIGGLASWAASWWNHAVDTVESGLKSILGALTQRVLTVLRIAIGAIATFTTVVSYIKKWTTEVTPNPPTNRFAVGNEAAPTGTFTAAIDTQAQIADWPSQLVDCAQVLHIALPTLSQAGLPVTWTVLGQEPGLVTIDAPTGPPFVGKLGSDLTSQLGYTTGREKTATGTLVTPTVTASVKVRRTEVDQLRALVTGFVTGEIPDILQPLVNPILAHYLELVTQKLDKALGVDGTTTIVVSHHVPRPKKIPPPSPSGTTPPSSAPSNQPVDLCALMPQATVSGIVGHPVGPPTWTVSGLSPLASTCSYGFADASIVYIPDDVSWCRQLETSHAGGRNFQIVPGVGDHAVYSTDYGVLAFYGNTCIQTFNEYKIDTDFSLSSDLALLQAVRARL